MKCLLLGLLMIGSLGSFAQGLTISSSSNDISAQEIFQSLKVLEEKTNNIDDVNKYAVEFLEENEEKIDNGAIFQKIISKETKVSESSDMACSKFRILILSEGYDVAYVGGHLTKEAKIKLSKKGLYSYGLINPMRIIEINWGWENTAQVFEFYRCDLKL